MIFCLKLVEMGLKNNFRGYAVPMDSDWRLWVYAIGSTSFLPQNVKNVEKCMFLRQKRMYYEQIEVLVGQANVSASIGV